MKNNLVFAVLAGMLLGRMSMTDVRADVVTLNPNQDNSMFAENNNSNGLGGLFVGPTAGTNNTTLRRALVRFDVASVIPAGSTIHSVTLRIERVIAGPSAGADVLSLHPVTAAWGEGTSFGVGKGAAPSSNDATWNFRFFNSTPWTTPGGDFGASSGTVTLDLGNEFTFASQAGMVTDVQNWVDNSMTNFGWLLKYSDETSSSTARYFSSREDSNVSSRPLLTVDFTAIPEPSSSLLIGVGVFVASRFRSRCRRS